MWLESLHLQQFRNYKTLDVDFHQGLNIFLGQNAQGKTNILEAIYFLALTRSHRTRADKDLISFHSNYMKVSGILNRSKGITPLDIELTEKGRMTKINYLKQARLSDYIGQMNVVLFAPEDLQLVKGAPSLRRKFMDVELGQMKPLYLADLSQYTHVLKQRNTYLKTAGKIDTTFLSVLDHQLAEYGSNVILHRLDFLKRLEEFANQKMADLSQKKEELTLQYQSTIPLDNPVNLVATFLTELEKNHQRDIVKKNTSLGPHRDDILFFINGVNAHYGSQGQHRSLVLSLKLAEIELMHLLTRETPILLLDDVMSELDNQRQMTLLETISGTIQTFITTTSLEHLHHLPKQLKLFSIQQGQVTEQIE